MGDDFVPEERAQEYTHLLATLRSSAQQRVSIAAEEQARIIGQVRKRLAQTAFTSNPPEVGTIAPQQHLASHLLKRPGRTFTQFAAQLLAALVVLSLIFGAWALFRAYPFSHGTSVPSTASTPGPAAQAQSHGLEASMHVLVGGPYFLSELLPIDLSFTNHTQKPAGLDGSLPIANESIANACFPIELLAQVTQGSNPFYAFPQLDVACTQPYFVTEIEPGQTLTIHQYLPLTKSGDVTLARGDVSPDDGGDPLDRQWPTLHLHVQVSSQIPQDHTLALRNQGTQVIIDAPVGAKTHLLMLQSVTCDGYAGLPNPGQWVALSSDVLNEPACPAAHRHWIYVVSAPGYASVSGSSTA